MIGRRREKEAAFVEFATASQQSLFRQAWLLTGERAAAEDLVQSTLLRMYAVWLKPGRIENPRAYASTTMVRQVVASTRRNRREHVGLEDVREAGTVDRPEDGITVIAALRELPPRTRAVIVLRFWEDLSVGQTAEALNITTGTVKSTTSKGLARLRVALGDAYQFQGATA